MKNTVQKQAVLGVVNNMTNHPTAEEVFLEVKKENDGIGIATVYRNLNSFAKKGLIRKVTVQNAPDRFDYRLDDHEHLLCQSCGRVFDVDADIRIKPKNTNIQVNGYSLTLHGLCENCACL